MRNDKRLRQLWTRTEKNPYLALEHGWFRDPAFLEGFFDRCENLALTETRGAMVLARRAVEFAETHGDPHLIHRSHGVLAHAYLAELDFFWAGKVLAANRARSLACCPRCRGDQLRREGDLLGEQKRGAEALEKLQHCLAEGGSFLEDDARGRILFLRSIAHFRCGHRERALADAGETLRLLELSSPRGYFLDTAACIAVYVGGGDERQDATALTHLESLLRRIKDRDGWSDLRTRVAWVAGHLSARLGDVRRARLRLESACGRLLANGLPREAVAVALDVGQLRCRHAEPHGDSPRIARRLLSNCLARRQDLPSGLREGLEAVTEVLERHPELATRELRAFRASFIAPVPCALAERIGRAPDGRG